MSDFFEEKSIIWGDALYPYAATLIYVLFACIFARYPCNIKLSPGVSFFLSVELNVIRLTINIVIFVGICITMLQHLEVSSSLEAICRPLHPMAPEIQEWISVLYYSKYLGCLSTCLLILQNKPVVFVHGFHHSKNIMLWWLLSYSDMPWVAALALLECLAGMVVTFYYLSCLLKTLYPFARYAKRIVPLHQVLHLLSIVPCAALYALHNISGTPCRELHSMAAAGLANSVSSALFIVFLANHLSENQKHISGAIP